MIWFIILAWVLIVLMVLFTNHAITKARARHEPRLDVEVRYRNVERKNFYQSVGSSWYPHVDENGNLSTPSV